VSVLEQDQECHVYSCCSKMKPNRCMIVWFPDNLLNAAVPGFQ
jgi:hypothetical protein